MVDRRPTEFGGGPGMVQPEVVGFENEVQGMWEVYATNPGAPATDDSSQPTAEKVGLEKPWEVVETDLRS